MFIAIGVVIPFSIGASTALSLRFYTRIVILRSRPILEDYLLVIGFTTNMAICLASLWAYHDGLGRHVEDVKPTPEMAVELHKYLISLAVVWFFSLGVVKTSVLLLYRRIFSVMKGFVRLCWFVLVANIIITILGIFGITIYLCFPASYWWNRWAVNPPNGHCNDAQAINVSFACVNFCVDCLIIVMPIPLLKRLNLNEARKKALMVVFGLSIVPAVAAGVHIVSMIKLHGPDYTYWIYITFLTGAMEIFVAIICNCIPTLTPLAMRYFPSLFSTTNGNSSQHSSKATPTDDSGSRGQQKAWAPHLSGSSSTWWGSLRRGSGLGALRWGGAGGTENSQRSERMESSCSQEPITMLTLEEFQITKTTELTVEQEVV
ncbi:hypothetical protein K490DRAFT_61852 [Saccharata proteae CBS 121410]|uniref:Rhodopsin domain-containing protein n=1 Tax=Saccharata proteae CBS 121410 TaxID=1314787 RepID=A0A9P4HZX8_9PEZI|nr:hypothetical protein K490DRAFT_61852 [Saccharata proteae CBS 121410]